ncbi:hypothetical protein OC834_008048 [Tilletia horrida]|nr:hypothetical protein OC834_008048 [Tilletia horrida]
MAPPPKEQVTEPAAPSTADTPPQGASQVLDAGALGQLFAELRTELRAIREGQAAAVAKTDDNFASVRFAQLATDARMDDMSARLEALERGRDGRAPSPDTAALPESVKRESTLPVRFTAQDARSTQPSSPPAAQTVLPPHLRQLTGPDLRYP